MTGLHRTPLTTPRKIECVAKALAGQEALGGIAALSREFGISRPTIYAAKEVASEVLREHFEATGSDRVCSASDPLSRCTAVLRADPAHCCGGREAGGSVQRQCRFVGGACGGIG